MKKKIAILGSTGSIGTQALEVIGNHNSKFELELITANKNVDLLIEQALKYKPSKVVIGDEKKYKKLKSVLERLPITILSGEKSINEVVSDENIDIVLTAMVGFSGLIPTINALKAGKDIALANKETLVVAGEYINSLANQHKCRIIPVDSEHSAIFQCLTGEEYKDIEKIYLTASGGPFRGMSYEQLKSVTKQQALEHPNWCMGDKITIDSATLMNKGLEAIEAHWLFHLQANQIQVIVHPQSIIHSIVQFKDGSMKAQMGLPDMRLPIQYALSYPNRLPSNFNRFNFANYPELTFEQPDSKCFKNLELAYLAMKKGGNMPCIMNAANEIAVDAFLNEQIGFLNISNLIEMAMDNISFLQEVKFPELKETDAETRNFVRALIP